MKSFTYYVVIMTYRSRNNDLLSRNYNIVSHNYDLGVFVFGF